MNAWSRFTAVAMAGCLGALIAGAAGNAAEITVVAGAGPLPYTLIRALGPRYRDELEAEVESAMESLGDPDDAYRYHHSYLIAVARKR